ncbi:MAG: hypothetical protein CR959_01660 [Fusobacteriales bacterium]|nr:MAG: hypothetical protein CR959_01660 [Fusobacteriales bacterium]
MKKKIVFYVRNLEFHAISKNLQTIVNSLDKKNFEITIIVGEKKYSDFILDNFSKEIKIKFILNDFLTSFRSKKYKKNFKNKIFLDFIKLFLNLKSIYEIKKNNFDTFIDYQGMYLSDFLKYTSIKNKITVLHENRYIGITNDKKRKKIKKKFKNYNKIIFLAKEQTNDFKLLYPDLKDRFFNIYNCFDINKIKELSMEKFTFDEIKWVDNKNYGLMLSRLENGKDFQTVLNALGELKKIDKLNFNFYFLGEGSLKSFLEKEIKNLNLEDNVFLLGNKTNPYKWIKKSNFVIMTSHSEGLNNVIIESLILEKIVIANKFKYGAEEILQNKYGFLFNNENYLELVNILKKITKENKKSTDYFPEIKKSYSRFSSINILEEFNKIL